MCTVVDHNISRWMTNCVEYAVWVQGDTSRAFKGKNRQSQGNLLVCLLFDVVLEIVVRKSGIGANSVIIKKSVQLLVCVDNVAID